MKFSRRDESEVVRPSNTSENDIRLIDVYEDDKHFLHLLKINILMTTNYPNLELGDRLELRRGMVMWS